MEIKDYLKQIKEIIPSWLKDFDTKKPIDFKTMMASRVVYYPGALADGQPIKTFNMAHYAHVYLYTDYNVKKNDIKEKFKVEFKGYNCIHIHDFKVNDLVPNGYHPSIPFTHDQVSEVKRLAQGEVFGFVGIFERESGYDDNHGAKRFAVVYLGADGIATYDALFASKLYEVDVLVLQDHGFAGDNYDKFGATGLMHQIATKKDVFPSLILCASNTSIWDGYKKEESLAFVVGGMNNNQRYLYTKI